MVPSVGEGPGLVILRKQARAVSEIGFIANLLAFRRGLGYDEHFLALTMQKREKSGQALTKFGHHFISRKFSAPGQHLSCV